MSVDQAPGRGPEPCWMVPDWPAPAVVRALTTIRAGGHSRAPFDGLNLGLGVGDDAAAVRANRALLRTRAELPSAPLWLRQVHGSRVVHAASGVARAARADACVARAPHQVCAVLTADCLPILLCDRAGSRIAAAHAGWRGLAAGVLEATVIALATPPAELLAWIGPAIGGDAYEVGNVVRETLLAQDPATGHAFTRNQRGRWQCDLVEVARRRLMGLGVAFVAGGNWCTAGDRARFFSYRRDRRTGRMVTLIWIDGA